MSGRLMYAFLVVPILGLAVIDTSEAADPSLVGWWKLDDAAGTLAADSSAHGNDATLNGAFDWVAGQLDGALHLDGSSAYGEIAADPSLVVLNQGDFAFMAWLRTDALDGATQYALQQGDLNGTGRSWLYINATAEVCTYVGGGTTNSGFVVEAETWYHAGVVVTELGTTDSIQIYVNGQLEGTGSRGMESCEGGFFIGTHKNMATGTRWTGILDDLRLYKRLLSRADIDAAMLGIAYEAARGPSPANEATDVRPDVALSWSPGAYAATHDVYWGTLLEDVEAASRSNPLGVLVSQGQAETTYRPGGPLDLEQTYYWRVDEVNDAPDFTVYKGVVWSFTAEPVAYTIQDVLATSNVTSEEGRGPEKVVDGSGLSADGAHSTAISDMWTGTAPVDVTPYIQFEFDRLYKLHALSIWNYNMVFETTLGIGIKEAAVEYSEDGATWMLLNDIELAQAPALGSYTSPETVDLQGVAAKYVRLTANSNFGGGADYGLSEVRFTYIPAAARAPEPADGATNVDPGAVLAWRPGRDAVSHELYAGLDPNALASMATTDQPSYAGAFDLGATYYWSVDEIGADGAWGSAVWSFSTQDYVVVEDFESYNDDFEAGEAIWQAWIDGLEPGSDGGGSFVGNDPSPFAELVTVQSGNQSMPLFFGNIDGYTHSQTTHAFETPQDWTAYGIGALTLYIHGDATNVTGRLYAKINGTKVYWQSVSDVLQRTQWMLWPIDLTTINTDLTNVTSLSVGIDDAGASGVLYVDEIRLYPPMFEMVEPIVPDDGDPNLAAYYAFDGSPDATLGGLTATVAGSPSYVDGLEGQAISFNGVNDSVISAFAADEVWPASSVSVWAKAASLGQPQYGSVFNNNADANDFQIDTDGTDPGNYHYRGTSSRVIGPVTTEWVHLAVTCDGQTTDLYYNGLYVATLNAADTQFGQLAFGINRALDNWFAGLVDEARVYDRCLSAGEVAGLAGIAEPVPVVDF